MRRLIPILETIINNLNYVVKVSNITDNGDGTYTLTTCDTFYITEGTKFTQGANQWKVTSFTIDTEFTIEPVSGSPTFPDVDEITLPTIGFHSGTLKDATGERGTLVRMRQQTIPFVWNREPMRLLRNRDDESPLFGTLDLELYIVNSCNPTDWLNNDHHRLSVEPMMNISDRIFQYIDSNEYFFNTYEDEDIIPRVYLGNQGENRSYDERLFEENLSGIQSNFSLEIAENAINECCGS